MIKTNYGIEKINEKKGIPVYEGIQVLLPDDYKEGTILGDDAEYWQIYTHYRGMNSSSFNNIAFEIIDANVDEQINLYLSHKSNPSIEELNNRLSYDSNSELYFDEPDVTVEYDKKKMKLQLKYSGNLSKTAVGHNTAGQFYVHAMNSNDEIVCRSPKIKVLPSSLSEDDYLEILNDLIKIKEDLIIDKESKVSLTGKWGYRKELIEECIRQIMQPIQLINANPAQTLIPEVAKVKRSGIKKDTARTLIDKVVFPQKKYLQYKVQKKSIDIYENQIIKYTLIQLRKKIKEYSEREEIEGNHKINDNNLEIEIFEERYGASASSHIIEFNQQIKKWQDKIKNHIEHRNKGLDFPDLPKEVKYGGITVSISENKLPDILLNVDRGAWQLTIKECKWKKGNLDQTILGDLLILSRDITSIGYIIESIENMDADGAYIEYSGVEETNNIIFMSEIQFDSFKNANNSTCDLLKIATYFHDPYTLESMQKLTEIEEKKEWLMKLIEKKESDVQLNVTNWDKVILEIDKLLSLELFSEISTVAGKWTPTQIFASDPKYMTVWNRLTSLNEELDYMQSYEEPLKNYIQLAKTQDIYENWCYFKMIHFLVTEQGWRIDSPEELAKQIDNSLIERRGTQYKIKCTLKHSNSNESEITLNVYYEHKLNTNKLSDAPLKPDYHFEFEIKGRKHNIYADAKYKNYLEMETPYNSEFTSNIRDVAINNYINRFATTENQANASFIIHPDINSIYTFFGGLLSELEKEKYQSFEPPEHKFGAFVLLPSQNLYLKVFFKMIMEYHLGLYRYCWNCGETDNIQQRKISLKSNRYKYHFHCGNCGDFWVKTHCGESSGKHKLIKHMTNYHFERKENKGNWYVQCPECKS